MQGIQRFFTVGVYGTNEASFFHLLQQNKIDTFCDVRLRRGMRGSMYAYVNSSALQHHLDSLGIRYIHFKSLAPTPEIRAVQQVVDTSKGIQKRLRESLSEDFIKRYEALCLKDFKPSAFIQSLGEGARNIVLFCVERYPQACHRSLIAKRLVEEGFDVEDITI